MVVPFYVLCGHGSEDGGCGASQEERCLQLFSYNSLVRVVNRDFRWIYRKKHSNSTHGDTEGSVDITEDAGFRVFAAVVSFSLNKKAVQSYII